MNEMKDFHLKADEKWQYLNAARGMMSMDLFGLYVYLYTNYNDQYGYAFPSHKKMIDDLQVSDRTLKQDLAMLETFGFIVRERGHRWQNTRYYFPH